MAKTEQPSLTGCAWLTTQPLQAVLAVLGGADGQARVAGGAVRNALLDEVVNDIDIATVHRPDEVTARCQAAGLAVHPTGIDHGTVSVVARAEPEPAVYEVTTLRVDVETDGRHAKVGFTEDWAADAARRDFTINALYCDADGNVFDPLGGLADIETHTVRFCGKPKARIREDYLRILRFFRFHARYGSGAPDGKGLEACIAEKQGLAKLSRERVRDELLKTLVAPGAAEVVELMADTGILRAALDRKADPDRLQRMIAIDSGNALPGDALLRLAALYGAVPVLASRLHLSNKQEQRLKFMQISISPKLSEAERKLTLYRHGRDAYRDAVRYRWAASDKPGKAARWLELYKFADTWEPPQFPLTGADVLELGLPPGPKVGKLLMKLEDWWIAEDFPLDRPRLLTELRQRVEAD